MLHPVVRAVGSGVAEPEVRAEVDELARAREELGEAGHRLAGGDRGGQGAREGGLPARESDVTWVTSTLGWPRRSRRSSPPVYPEPPTMPILIAGGPPRRSPRSAPRCR